MEFITQAEPLLQVFWYIALFSSLVFIGLLLVTLAGGSVDHSGDMDMGGDHGAHDFQVFSFRNLLNFLLGFSWAGVALYAHVESRPLLIVFCLSVGAGFVWFFFVLLGLLHRLSSDQTQLTENAIGKTGTVYLNIPAHRSGQGKVLVSMAGAMHEFDAVTDGAPIPNGATIEVVDTLEGPVLLVSQP